ncbi:MAG: hypothetical protein JWO67_1496, partial [Streptosporangiaceae bacterium]|nr:hypothetical protein [Streptosporangiaceae bacterium]
HAVVAAGGYAVSEEHGVKVDHVDLSEAGAVGRYLFKDGDHARIEPIDGVGAEMAFGGEKNGKAGRMGPFQLGDAAATGEAAMVEAWQEREYGTYGVRKMYLSNGMKARLAALGVVDDRTDAEIAADAGAPREPLALIPRDTWYGHVVPVKGRRLALIRAAEALGAVGVRTLIESWGLVWGVDVLPAPVENENEEN